MTIFILKTYINATYLDFNTLYSTLVSGYQTNGYKQWLLGVVKDLAYPGYLLETILDPDCDLQPTIRQQLLAALLFQARDRLNHYRCEHQLSSAILLGDTGILEIMLTAYDSNELPIFNPNVRTKISETTAFEHAYKLLLESKTQEALNSMQKVIRILKKYSGVGSDQMQYQCDLLHFSKIQEQLESNYSTLKEVVNNSFAIKHYLDFVLSKDELISNLESLESITSDITYLERYHPFNSSLLAQLNQARRTIFQMKSQLPTAIQTLNWNRCMHTDIYNEHDRCHYPTPLTFIPPHVLEQMLSFNTLLVTKGTVRANDVVQVMGQEYSNKGRVYLQNLGNAIARLKQDGLLFNQEIFGLISTQLNAAYPIGIATDNPRALAEVISVLMQIKRHDGSRFIDSQDYLNRIKQAAQFKTDIYTLGAYPLTDLCYLASILQKLAALDMISEHDYNFDFSIRGTIDLLLDWLRYDNWQDPGHLLKALNDLEAEGLLDKASLSVFLRGITSKRPSRVSPEYKRHVLRAFNDTEFARFEEHISNYIKEEGRKQISSSWYARLYTNVNETLCADDVQYIPISPSSSVNFLEIEKGPIILVHNETKVITNQASLNQVTFIQTPWNVTTEAASHGFIRGTSHVVEHHLRKRFSPWAAYACGQLTYAVSLFSLNLKSQCDQNPDQTWDAAYTAATSHTVQQLIINAGAQCIESVGLSLEKNNYSTLGKGLRAISSLTSFGLFAHSAANSPALATISVVAGIGTQVAVESLCI